MFIPDLRAWLGEVEKLGQLMTVGNDHWDLELSTIEVPGTPRDKASRAVFELFGTDRLHGK